MSTPRTRILSLLFLLGFSLPGIADTVWVDVRSSLEHTVDHIDGDIRISHGDIVDEVTHRYPDRKTKIYLYCRSGGRAGQAAEALTQAGYTHVVNAGGIDDARRARGIAE